MGQCEIAVYGLGVMGSSLARNMISHGFPTAVYSKKEGELSGFENQGSNCFLCKSLEELLDSLRRPRCIFLMITAGSPVDQVLEELVPLLDKGDVVIDGGNSFYQDTARRSLWCKARGIHYMGVGVSGGEKGARNGPSIMAGGSREGWERSKKILQSIAAQAWGSPCCTYISEGGAGHYVKTVHNGIEYAILQLIAETYCFMKQVLGLSREEIISSFESWNQGKLSSYLMEISISVLKKKDEDGEPLVEKILDVAGQKGTGKWTIEEGIARGVYLPTIYEAVSARCFSGKKELRKTGKRLLSSTGAPVSLENPAKTLGDALLMGMILSYSQGLELVVKASQEEGWDIKVPDLIDVWRDGCIIRSSLLEEISRAQVSEEQPLVLSQVFGYIDKLEPSLREVNEKAVHAGMALPGMASVLHYYDYYRMERMPVYFIQALRDCFGAHTYERVDKAGSYHTDWE